MTKEARKPQINHVVKEASFLAWNWEHVLELRKSFGQCWVESSLCFLPVAELRGLEKHCVFAECHLRRAHRAARHRSVSFLRLCAPSSILCAVRFQMDPPLEADRDWRGRARGGGSWLQRGTALELDSRVP